MFFFFFFVIKMELEMKSFSSLFHLFLIWPLCHCSHLFFSSKFLRFRAPSMLLFCFSLSDERRHKCVNDDSKVDILLSFSRLSHRRRHHLHHSHSCTHIIYFQIFKIGCSKNKAINHYLISE